VKAKPIIPRQSVSRDIDEALAYYLDEGAAGAALGFIEL
jgi:toxin ParE1/3/4